MKHTHIEHTCPWSGETCRACSSKSKPVIDTGGIASQWALASAVYDAIERYYGHRRSANRFHVQFMQVKESPKLVVELVEKFVNIKE